MIKNTLTIFFVVLLVFSCRHENKSNYGIERSEINNLSFKDIKKIKEYKSCSTGSISFFDWYKSLFYPRSDGEYKRLVSRLSSLDGDSTLSTSVKMGGIKTIKVIDYSYEVDGIFSRKHCIIVYGE